MRKVAGFLAAFVILAGLAPVWAALLLLTVLSLVVLTVAYLLKGES